LQQYLLEVFAHIDPHTAQNLSKDIYAALDLCDIEKVVELLGQLFAHVPYQLHVKQEKYYHSLLMMVFIIAGINPTSEYSTSHGRIDLIFEMSKVMYVIEIKFNGSPDDAINQILERKYYEQFLIKKKKIILLGLSFNKEPHDFNITYATKVLE
jgi:hypothetical protein